MGGKGSQNELMNELITRLFVEQPLPLALPGSPKYLKLWHILETSDNFSCFIFNDPKFAQILQYFAQLYEYIILTFRNSDKTKSGGVQKFKFNSHWLHNVVKNKIKFVWQKYFSSFCFDLLKKEPIKTFNNISFTNKDFWKYYFLNLLMSYIAHQ